MPSIYKSEGGARAVRERYLEILKHWPVPHEELRVPTAQGETFVVACGTQGNPSVLLLHGSGANSAMWMGDAAVWSAHFRVYAIDMLGEPGLSARVRPSLASEAHALWLDDVMRSLGISRASFVGVSLGGWLAVDYAIRRPERADRLALLCPAGIGRQKIPVKVLVLAALGRWGARRAREIVLGRVDRDRPVPSAFLAFTALVHEHFRPRREKLPVFGDGALSHLSVPLLAFVGGRDVLLDSADTKQRLERCVRDAEVVYIPEAGHLILGQTAAILDFLLRKPAA